MGFLRLKLYHMDYLFELKIKLEIDNEVMEIATVDQWGNIVFDCGVVGPKNAEVVAKLSRKFRKTFGK